MGEVQSNDFSCLTTGDSILRIVWFVLFSLFYVVFVYLVHKALLHWHCGKIKRVFGSRAGYSCRSVFSATKEQVPVNKSLGFSGFPLVFFGHSARHVGS